MIQMSNDSDYHHYCTSKGGLKIIAIDKSFVVLEAQLDPWVGQMLVELC